jgi:hypothetical protein
MCLGRASWWQELEEEEEAVHLLTDKKQRAGKGLVVTFNLQRPPSMTYFLQIKPTP